jgi:hypothetical protein
MIQNDKKITAQSPGLNLDGRNSIIKDTPEKFDSSAFPPDILNDQKEMKKFLFGMAGTILILSGLTASIIGGYQLLIRWKLGMDLSKYEDYTVMVIVALFIFQTFKLIGDIDRKRSVPSRFVKIYISMMVVATILVSIFLASYVNILYLSITNLIIGLLVIFLGLFLYRLSKGTYKQIMKELISREKKYK